MCSFQHKKGTAPHDFFYDIQITNPPKLGNLTVEKKTENNESGTFPFTIKAWKDATTLKKIGDLTFGFDGLYARFTSKVSIQGDNPQFYNSSYDIGLNNNTFDGFDDDWAPIGNEDLWDLAVALGDHFYNRESEYFEEWDITIDHGQNYSFFIFLDDLKTNDQGEEYIFGFYLEDNEKNSSIDALDSSPTEFIKRIVGDAKYVDFSKQGFSRASSDTNTYEFSLENDGNITVQIPNGYNYRITESEIDGWELVDVDSSASGTMDITKSSPKVIFKNKKKIEEKTTSVTVDPPVTKIVEGTEDKDIFTYTLTAISGPNDIAAADMPMPEGSSNGQKQITKPGAGEYEFGEFELSLSGTYVYQIKEETGDLEYEYDSSTYTVKYEVTVDGGELKATTTITKYDDEVKGVIFTNKMKSTPNDPVVPPMTGDNFNLILYGFLLGISIIGILGTLVLSGKYHRL